jgi:hypothetical protein
MIRNETIAADNPIAILATAILCMIEEKLLFCPWRILFDMKYERFKEWLNFEFIVCQNKKK